MAVALYFQLVALSDKDMEGWLEQGMGEKVGLFTFLFGVRSLISRSRGNRREVSL